MSKKLPRSFYDRPTLQVARDLLGQVIVFGTPDSQLTARIIEVEAYIGQDDPACHAARGMTERNRVMFGQPGFSYVYFIYGMYHCFNIVTERDGFPAAVLIRAAEPIEGTESMRTRSPKGKSDLILSGPGKFCRSFGLTRDHSGVDLTGDTLYLTEGEDVSGQVVATGRVGIKDGSDLPYRLYQDDSKAVSGSR